MSCTPVALDVLIVDDSAVIRKILRRALLRADLPLGRIEEAGSGLEALERLETASAGVVLLDVNMPKMDGLQLLAEIKSRPQWRRLPVIMVTTEGATSRVLEAMRLGAAGYIKKPFSPDQIRDKLLAIC